ncbi:MAG: hypothetical protein CMF96_08180 [Candidatus Marinimicrobia bacterium]|nr:hypothetical protein [Candidatus Neomarinimicrobiota bacterium]|tara:strand:+ start:497 stop:685 length:189 start_codon:yes stop_codon:yes gene_type:complete
MSEWFDSQKKVSVNFRQLLQERIEKANPCRKLSSEESNCLCKEFDFTAGMLKCALARGRAQR